MTVTDERTDTTSTPTSRPATCGADLKQLSPEALMDLYLGGDRPASVRAIEGDPTGIPVGLHAFSDSRFERWLHRKADAGRFVWHGKSFRASSDLEGWGFNRLALGPALEALPFRVFVAPSVFDGEPCIALDYNVKRNPRSLRTTWDELREVLPGIFLGPVTVKMFGRHKPIVWFAVDTTVQAPLIGV